MIKKKKIFTQVILLLESHEVDEIIKDFDHTKEPSSGSKKLLNKLYQIKQDQEITSI